MCTADICRTAEASLDAFDDYTKIRKATMDTPDFKTRPNAVQESVASSVVKTAIDLDADLLMVLSHTGATGRAVGQFRMWSCLLVCWRGLRTGCVCGGALESRRISDVAVNAGGCRIPGSCPGPAPPAAARPF